MWTQPTEGGNVVAVAFAPGGGTLYAQDSERGYTAWDLATRTGRRLFADPETVGESRQVTNHFPRLFVSPDGRFLVANTAPPIVWDMATGAVHATVPDEHAFAGVSAGGGGTRVECVTRDWLGFATWDFVRRQPGPEFRGWPASGTIKTHHFDRHGRRVALLGWDEAVTVCDAATREVVRSIPPAAGRVLQHCRFTPDGEALVLYEGDAVSVWDLATRRVRAARVACDRPYWLFAFHPTQPLAAARRRGGLLALIDLRTGRDVRVLDLGLGANLICAAFSPDGLTCAVGGSDGRFALIDVDA